MAPFIYHLRWPRNLPTPIGNGSGSMFFLLTRYRRMKRSIVAWCRLPDAGGFAGLEGAAALAVDFVDELEGFAGIADGGEGSGVVADDVGEGDELVTIAG